MVDGFNPKGVWTPFGAFSMGVIQGQGQVIHLKGQVALDKDGQVVGRDDMRTQTRITLENIQTVLASVGGRMSDIVSLTHYVTDIEEFMKTGDVRREFFPEPFPVTTTGFGPRFIWARRRIVTPWLTTRTHARRRNAP